MNVKNIGTALNILLGVAGFGCTKTAEPAQVKIFGGQPSNDRWVSAVALLSYQSADCSGVLVHSRLVITAAHCIENGDENLEVYLGRGDDESPLQGQGLVERMVPSPRFGANPKGYNDVGYIVLKEPLPVASDDIIPILSQPDEKAKVLQAGYPVKIVGFGQRENGAYGSKYEADSIITGFHETEVKMGGNGSDACGGDSGGPAYLQLETGEWRVLGVASRGRECGKGGIWSRIDAHLCWIQKDSGIDLGVPNASCGM